MIFLPNILTTSDWYWLFIHFLLKGLFTIHWCGERERVYFHQQENITYNHLKTVFWKLKNFLGLCMTRSQSLTAVWRNSVNNLYFTFFFIGMVSSQQAGAGGADSINFYSSFIKSDNQWLIFWTLYHEEEQIASLYIL